MRPFPSLVLATLLMFPVGALVQRAVSFDIVSLRGMGSWAWLAWPLVLLGLGATALAVVAWPVGQLFRHGPSDKRVNLALRTGVEVLFGTLLFRLVSFPISLGETALLLLPQIVFFSAHHVLRADCPATKSEPAPS